MCSGVHEWQEDVLTPMSRDHKMRPVLCADYVAALERAVVELSADKGLPASILKSCSTDWRDGV